jgi:membrane protease YdiL (CAAX protease family)
MPFDGTNVQATLPARITRILSHLTTASPIGDLSWRSTGVRQGAYLTCISGVTLAIILRSYIAYAAAGAVALILYGSGTGWNHAALGLRLTPIQGWKYWFKVAIILGSIVGLTCLSAWLFALTLGIHIFVPQIDPSYPPVRAWLVDALILAPVLEELVYRFALCVPIVRRFGPMRAIILSGTVFALAHFIGGNPGPDNFIAGFILAWAFLKSGTLLVPILLHFAGNLCVVLFGVVMFYWPVFVLRHGT